MIIATFKIIGGNILLTSQTKLLLFFIPFNRDFIINLIAVTRKNIVVRFGCYIYQEGLEYNEIKDIVIECERLGFYSVWLKDNFIPWTLFIS